MSLYNLVNGRNNELVVILSMLLNKRVDQYFPRFRDVFTGAEGYPDGEFYVYTRMGGGNRDYWERDDPKENCDCPTCRANRIEQESWCAARIDDSFDNTYCMFVIKFTDPEQRAIYEKLIAGKPMVEAIENAEARFAELFPSQEAETPE